MDIGNLVGNNVESEQTSLLNRLSTIYVDAEPAIQDNKAASGRMALLVAECEILEYICPTTKPQLLGSEE
jgi:hypothetical protein